MPRISRAARILGQIGARTAVGNCCHHHCSLRWNMVKPSAAPFVNLKIGKMLSMNSPPLRPAVCGPFHANVGATSTCVCALDNTTLGAYRLFGQAIHELVGPEAGQRLKTVNCFGASLRSAPQVRRRPHSRWPGGFGRAVA